MSGSGSATLEGGGGNDTIFGSNEEVFLTIAELEPHSLIDQSVDFLDGGSGDDLIFGSGMDLITSGDGEDTINLYGADNVVSDFDPDVDQLRIYFDAKGALGATDRELFNISHSEDNTFVKYGEMTLVTLPKLDDLAVLVVNDTAAPGESVTGGALVSPGSVVLVLIGSP